MNKRERKTMAKKEINLERMKESIRVRERESENDRERNKERKVRVG